MEAGFETRIDARKVLLKLYRQLRKVGAADLTSETGFLQPHQMSRQVTCRALAIFRTLYRGPSDAGNWLVDRRVMHLWNGDFIAGSSVAVNLDLHSAVTNARCPSRWPAVRSKGDPYLVE